MPASDTSPSGLKSKNPISADEFSSLMGNLSLGASAAPPKVAVGVSGGADSMALMLMVDQWAKSYGGSALGITIDHGLRDDSAKEADQVSGWLSTRGIEHKIIRWENGRISSGGVQARARDARYKLMGAHCEQSAIRHLFIAHNMEDQAETFIMRLRHQSGLDGLGGMAAERKLTDSPSVSIIRPFLNIAKSRLKDTLEHMRQPWVEDPSNSNAKFERVRTRELLLNLQVSEGISPKTFARAADGVRALRHILDSATDGFIASHTRSSESKTGYGATMYASEFLRLPRLLQARVLSRLFTSFGKCTYPPGPEKIDRILDWLSGTATGRARTLGGCKISINGDFLLVKPEPERKKTSAPMVNNVTYQRSSQKTGENSIVSLVAGR